VIFLQNPCFKVKGIIERREGKKVISIEELVKEENEIV